MTEPLLIEVDKGIATLTLNRPEAGNSISMGLARALMEAAIRCDTDDAIRCVVLTGAGRLFSAGGDISGFQEAGERISAYLSELVGYLNMAMARFLRMPKPLLTVVNGPAAGAGLSLAIAGDIVLAAQSAHFTTAYGGVGLTPDAGMSWLLPRLVGLRRAQEMLVMNNRVGADEAAAMGLVTRVVADDGLALEASQTAAQLAASATQAIGGARRLLLASYEGALEGQLEREARSVAAAGAGRESREGVAAFLARRRPDFTALGQGRG